MKVASLLKWAGAVGAVILVVSLVADSCQRTRREQQALAEKATADSLRVIAETHLAEATLALATIKQNVVVLKKRDTVLVNRVKEIFAEPVPDTCRTVVARRDTLILDQQDQIAHWRGVSDDQSAATDKLLGVVDTLRASNDSLSKAYKKLLPRHYDLLGRLLHPEIKPALFAGVCTDGKPCAGLGFSITF